MQSWINASRHTPVKSPRDQDVVDAELKRVLSGYTCVTDMPPILFTGELVRLWPDAVVIVTTRGKEEWWRSMEPVLRNVDRDNRFLAWVWCFLPTLRLWQDWVDAMRVSSLLLVCKRRDLLGRVKRVLTRKMVTKPGDSTNLDSPAGLRSYITP